MTNGLKPPSLGSLYGYDVFGYVIPGGIFITMTFGIEQWALSRISLPDGETRSSLGYHTPVKSFIDTYSGTFSGELVGGLIFGLVLLGTSYVIGQLISTLSSLIMDRIAVAKIYGYPIPKFLSMPTKVGHYCNKAEDDIQKGLLKGTKGGYWPIIFLSFQIYLATQIIDNIYNLSDLVVLLSGIPLALFSCLKIATYYASHFSPLYNRRVFNFLTLPARIAITFHMYIFNPILSMYGATSRFNSAITLRFRELYRQRFGMSPEESGREAYWLIGYYIRDNNPSAHITIRYYLRQYTFARNMSMCFFLILSHVGLSQFGRSIFLDLQANDKSVILVAVIAIALLSTIFAIRFYYVYYNLYNKSLFRTFVFFAHNESVSISHKVTHAQGSNGERTPFPAGV